MSETIIASYFENNGIPVSGLVPEIRIWEVAIEGNKLIIGSSQGTNDPGPVGGGGTGGVVGRNGLMSEISAGNGSQDGFYRYVFDVANGYDPSKCYIFRVDGGVALTAGDRYQVGDLSIVDNAEALVDLIYDEPATEHVNTGTIGELINNNSATTASLMMSMRNVQLLVDLAVKYQTNRTKIDPDDMTMTVYDSDCVTALRVFNLLDKNGQPSITEICERVPTSATDGLPTC